VQKQVLDKDTLLLEYSLGEQASYVFVVSQTSIRSYSLPKRAEIESLGGQVYEALAARNRHKAGETAAQRETRIAQADADYPKLGAELSRMVLAPAAADFGHKRLLIVGDGILLQIPFAALPDPAANPSQPLIVSHEIVNLPSASVVAEQSRELADRKAAPKQVVVFADPVFEHNDERVKARAHLAGAKVNIPPAESAMRDFEQAIGEAGLSTDRSSISRLLFSHQEADAIFALTRSNAGLEALGFDANKEAASSSELSNYRIVHFATHGLLNDNYPELSGIVLSLIDRQGHEVDGFLRLNEIYNLNLSADLVVLSACQTGLGRQIKGEGLIGLVRGFMYAGAPRVVASLWKVDDSASADLMARFYEKMLKDNETVPAALQHAQIEMSHEKRWSSPYFWAGFEMQGEWRAMK
jgi:CHAT domain-containing protein